MKTINTSNLKDYKSVTGGMNGYPVPELGIMIFADSIEELEKLKTKYDKSYLSISHWKDGWDFCENKGELLTDSKEWFENCLREDFFSVYNSIEIFVENEILWKLKEVETEEEKQTIQNEAQDFKTEYKNYDFFTRDDDGNFEALNFDTIYKFDTHHYRLGIFLSNEEYKIIY